jgi:site-specific DNA-methyltransferase (adenine-specific)
LVYLDPPFFTGKKQELRDRKNGNLLSFDDIWVNNEDYLQWMKIRLIEARRILKDSGSIFLHCDWHASHLIRVILDEVFHPAQFRSEIIWMYRRWSNNSKNFLKSHETIYFYSKTDTYKFKVNFEDYSFTTNIDQIWQSRVRDENNKAITPKIGGKYIPLRREKHGVPLRDVWEIPYVNPKAKERTGYPAQKPVELMLRIIDACADEGDLIVDPVCGSGSTLVAARIRKLKWIGIDINDDAIRISKRRLTANLDDSLSSHYGPFKLAMFYKLPREEKIRQLAGLLDMNIAHRNNFIDGFLRRTGRWKSVSVRYVENEILDQTIEQFAKASEDRNADLALVVLPRIDRREKVRFVGLNFGRPKICVLSVEDLAQERIKLEKILNDPPFSAEDNCTVQFS